MNYLQTLQEIRTSNKYNIVGFCSGGFDITHPGHVFFLEDCKKYCDFLVVCVSSDASRKIYKQDTIRPIWNEHIRFKMVTSLKPVDFAFVDESLISIEHPLAVLIPIFKALSPDRYFINTDATNIDYREELCRRYSIQMIIHQRWCPPEFEKISTTSIVKLLSGKE